MLRNYLKSAFRSLSKNRLFTLINLLGLITGMTVGMLLLHYIRYETSYDRFYPDWERIYRLRYERTSADGESVRFASCCPPAGRLIRERYPEVEKAARIYRYPVLVSRDRNMFVEERVFFAEPEIFAIFTWEFIQGDPLAGISQPNTLFLSRSAASRYFGDQDPVGQSLRLDQSTEYRVTGVFEDMADNSHLKCDFLLSFPNLISLYGDWIEEAWGYTGFFTYILFRQGADITGFEKKLPDLVENEFGEVLKQYNLTCSLPLQPLGDIHLTSHFMQEYEVNGNRDRIGFLLIIALFVLLIAWVNYINLTTALSLSRSQEVGLRKVAGASRPTLTGQFFLETVLMNMIAALLALGFIDLFLPSFHKLTGISPDILFWRQGWFWLVFTLLFVGGSLLSGIYPAFVMTTFRPVAFLRRKPEGHAKGITLRKILVVFQFFLSLSLITWTLAIFGQIRYMKKQDLGIAIEGIAVVKAPRVTDGTYGSKVGTFREELAGIPGVLSACFITEVPGKQIFWDHGGIYRLGSDESKNYQIVGIDYAFEEVFDVHFVSGRNFSEAFPSDSSALILNETAVRWMGFTDPGSAIGGKVDYWGVIYEIVGVMKDYHQQSPKQFFEPNIYRLMPDGWGQRGHFAIRYGEADLKPVLAAARELYEDFFPDNPFDYFLMEEYYGRQYKGDTLLGNVFVIFSFLAILVTVFGILGLVSFMSMQRIREFSIRKILGARVSDILGIFIRDFTLLIIIAFLVALPFCYFGLDWWLSSFASRTNPGILVYIFPLFIVMATTGLTIGGLIIKAARTNAIDILRYE